MKVAWYGIVGKVSNQGVISLVIHHNYYCRSLTGMEIIGAGPHGMLGEWAGPGQQEVSVDFSQTGICPNSHWMDQYEILYLYLWSPEDGPL